MNQTSAMTLSFFVNVAIHDEPPILENAFLHYSTKQKQSQQGVQKDFSPRSAAEAGVETGTPRLKEPWRSCFRNEIVRQDAAR